MCRLVLYFHPGSVTVWPLTPPSLLLLPPSSASTQPPVVCPLSAGPGPNRAPTTLPAGGRWQSKENLLSDMVDDPETFVALYDFQAQGDNQLSLKKGT